MPEDRQEPRPWTGIDLAAAKDVTMLRMPGDCQAMLDDVEVPIRDLSGLINTMADLLTGSGDIPQATAEYLATQGLRHVRDLHGRYDALRGALGLPGPDVDAMTTRFAANDARPTTNKDTDHDTDTCG